MNKSTRQLQSLCIAACLILASPYVSAEEASGDDAAVNIWVDNASLDLFVKQLASISGKTPQIDGVLPGIVSGRFNGSVEQTLNTLSDSYPVLFDVDEDVLRAIDKSSLSNVSIAMPNKALDDGFISELDNALLPGNTIEFREDSVRVSGHPSFVKRSAIRIRAALADSEASVSVATVVDAAAKEMIKDIQADQHSGNTVVKTERARQPILSVTDIPGYNTF